MANTRITAILVATVDANPFPGGTPGFDFIVLVVCGPFAVTLVLFMLFVSYVLRILTGGKRTLAFSTLPFLLFTSYILRLATLAKQTLSMGPLVLS